MFDVVSIGETMLRLSPGRGERLEQAKAYEVHVGGSESNTMVGLARLGMSTCWISRLVNNPLGRHIRNAIAEHGVDTSWIRWTEEDRTGVYFFEPGFGARGSEVIYDRAESAFARFESHELLDDPLRRTKVLHLTGISLALSDSVRSVLAQARERAVESNAKISFDFNYRAKLWPMAHARSLCLSWLQASDVVFIARRDAMAWLELEAPATDEELLRRLLDLRDGKLTVITLGPRGAIAGVGDDTHAAATVPIESGVGRLGGGDAFSAGFLCGWLEGKGIDASLRWGNAAALLKYSVPGDLPWFTRAEVERLAAGEIATGVTR
jgi:2-dehydro-3-deoxygluconokinase